MKDDVRQQVLKEGVTKALSMAKDLPWNVVDPDQLGQTILQFNNAQEPYFRRWAEVWFITMQYIFGQHNLRWSSRGGYAVDYDDLARGANQNSTIRPYTNIARIAAEALTSGHYGQSPTWAVETTADSATEGRRQKRLMSKLLAGVYEQQMCDTDVRAGAFGMSVFGQVAFESTYDWGNGNPIKIPKMKIGKGPELNSLQAFSPITMGLVQAPTAQLDNYGQPLITDAVNFERDQQGHVIYETISGGAPRLDALTPFEYRRAVDSSGMHKTKYVQIYRLVDFDDAMDRYGQVGGRTKYYGHVQPVSASTNVWQMALRLFSRLQYVTPPSTIDVGGRWAGSYSLSALSRKVYIIEHYDRPHPIKWPKGRRVIMMNGRVTHITTPDYNTNKIDGWHPLSEAQWINSFPSSIATGPMQDIVMKNREIDTMDRFIALAMRRSLGGQYLVKVGSGIDPNRLTGEPGMAHEVTDPFGIRILHDELAIPPVVAQIREMNKADAYEQSGALEAQRGSAAGKSGYQTRLLSENEDKRLAPSRRAFRLALAGAGEKLLYALHKNVIQLDDKLYSYMIARAEGAFTPSDVTSFLATPLNIGTQVTIEETSMQFKSTAQKRADLAQAMQVNPMLAQKMGMDPKMFKQFVDIYELPVKDGDFLHRERAQRENETFLDALQAGKPLVPEMQPRVLWEDADDVHLAEHTDFIIQNYEYLKNNPEVMFQYYVHREQHELNKQTKMGEMAMNAAMQAGPITQVGAQASAPSVQDIAGDSRMRQIEQMMQAKSQKTSTPGQVGGKAPGSPQGSAPKSAGAPGSEAKPGANKVGV